MGKKVKVITSFNQSYYDTIGKDCVSTWLTHWPESYELTCYVEDMRLPHNDRIQQIDFSELGHEYRSFQASDLSGRTKIFAKKAFSIIHAMQHLDADRIMWLDADVLTLRDVSIDLLDSVMPDHVVSTHMGVYYTEHKTGVKGDWLVPETGVFVLNKCHPVFDVFCDTYHRRYRERDFAGLRRSYDNDVYGAVIQQHAIPSFDLCQSLGKPYKTPLKHTVLGPYLHHYKAKHSKIYFADSQTCERDSQ
jgi:hypothetical protein